MTPWLTQTEIDDLCMPLKQHAAQIRFIRGMGITVREKPNGSALVMRAHFEENMCQNEKPRKPGKPVPNRDALIMSFQRG